MALANVNSTPGSGVNSSALNGTTGDKQYLFLPVSLAAKTTICSIMTVICIVGAIGNLSLISFVNRTKKKIGHREAVFNNMYLFLRSLAISDVLASISGPTLWLEIFWDVFQTGWPCKIRRYFAMVLPVVTIYNLTAVAFERYNCICRSTGKLSRARLRQLIKATWLLGFLVTLLPIFSYQGIRKDLNETHYTVTCGRDSSYAPYIVMSQIFTALTFIFPLIFLLVTSYRIVKVVRAQVAYRLALPSNNTAEKVRIEKRKQNKATRTLLILIAAFVVPYLVFVGYQTAKTIFRPSLDYTTHFIIQRASVVLVYFNSPVNFCIHLVQLPAFREEWRRRLAYFKRPIRLGVFTTKGKYVVSKAKAESRPEKIRRLSCPDLRRAMEHTSCGRRYSN